MARQPGPRQLDPHVVVAEVGGEIIAVAGHERVEHDRAGPLADHRYLTVFAMSKSLAVATPAGAVLPGNTARTGRRTNRW